MKGCEIKIETFISSDFGLCGFDVGVYSHRDFLEDYVSVLSAGELPRCLWRFAPFDIHTDLLGIVQACRQ